MMRTGAVITLACAIVLAGCTARTPAPTPTLPAPTSPPPRAEAPSHPDGMTPYAIAFWDEQRGLITGQSGCPIACGDYIIALTEDGGSHWKAVYRGPDRIGKLATVPGGAWASTAKGLLKSTDAGQSWQPAAPGYAEPTFADTATGWTLTATEGNRWNVESPIFVTRDGGATWAPIESPCSGKTGGTAAIGLVTVTEGWVGCVSQPGAGQQRKALYMTADGGTTWQEVGETGSSGYLRGLFFRPGGIGWAWHSRGVLTVTTDGGRTWHWPETVTQPETREAWDVWMLSDQTGYLLLHDNEDRHFKLVKTVDGGNSVVLVTQWPIAPPR